MKKLLITLIVLLASASILISCAEPAPTPAPAPVPTPAPTPAPTTTTETPESGPKYGGVLKIITLPGLKNIGYPGKVQMPSDAVNEGPAVEGLLGFELGPGGMLPSIRVVPKLATSWELGPDNKSLTFTLRKGVKFHDGTDFNAEAAKFNLDLLRLGVNEQLKTVTSVDIIDDYTIRLNFSEYYPELWSSMPGKVTMMVSPTAIETMGEEAMLHPVGTGPYKFVSYQRDISLKFERFDDYWGGKPYLDGLELIFMKDPMTALSSFKAGEAQVITGITPKDAFDLQATGKYIVEQPTMGGCVALGPDSAHPSSPFANIKVRQAVAYAIDNAAVTSTLGYGFYKPATQFWAPGGMGYNPEIVGYPYNVQKAKDLLTEAGYPNGFDTTIIYPATAEYQDLFTAVQGYLSEVGITAELQALDTSAFWSLTSTGWENGMIVINGVGGTNWDPGAIIPGRVSNLSVRIDTKSLYSPEDYNAKIAQARSEPDFNKRQELWQEIFKQLNDECLAIPIWWKTRLQAQTPQVQDLNMGTRGISEWDPQYVWLSK